MPTALHDYKIWRISHCTHFSVNQITSTYFVLKESQEFVYILQMNVQMYHCRVLCKIQNSWPCEENIVGKLDLARFDLK